MHMIIKMDEAKLQASGYDVDNIYRRIQENIIDAGFNDYKKEKNSFHIYGNGNENDMAYFFILMDELGINSWYIDNCSEWRLIDSIEDEDVLAEYREDIKKGLLNVC